MTVGSDDAFMTANPRSQSGSGLEEVQEGGVDDFRVRPGDVVGPVLDGDERQARHQRRQSRRRGVVRQDPVGVAVDDEERHVDLREISTEVREPGVDAGVHGERAGLQRHRERGLPRGLADPGAAQDIDVEEVVEEVFEIRRPVRHDRGLDALEHLAVHALGVVLGLEQVRRDAGHQHRPADPGGPVPTEVPGDLAAAHREADERHVLQVQVLEQCVQVVGERVVVEADGGAARLTEPAPVVGDDPVAGLEERPLLLVPRAAVERESMDEHHGLADPVVLEVDLDVVAVLLADDELGHGASPGGGGWSRQFWSPDGRRASVG